MRYTLNHRELARRLLIHGELSIYDLTIPADELKALPALFKARVVDYNPTMKTIMKTPLTCTVARK